VLNAAGAPRPETAQRLQTLTDLLGVREAPPKRWAVVRPVTVKTDGERPRVAGEA
jgi:hypothetical protein